MPTPIPSARDTARLVASGAVTATDAARACLDAVAEREAAVGAWQVVGRDEALAQAARTDRAVALAEAVLPLAGIPLGVKDNIDTVDLPTGYGSAIYDGHRPAADAACVALARRAGMTVLGKTVLTEFAYYRPGKTANPHNTAHTPGGSSQGSAAAVAAGMVPLALGTQTAGSVIRPAAYCGVVGFKPSWGLIPRQGVKLLSDWLDTVGVFARDVGDAAFFVAGLTGRASLRPEAAATTSLRIAVLRPPYPATPEPEALAALDRAARALRDAGHSVSDLPNPAALHTLPRLQRLIMAYDMERALGYERRAHESKLSSILKSFLDEGAGVSPRAYDAALATARDAQRDDTVFGGADLILSPPAPGEAPLGLQATGDPAFNQVWTLLQGPCITVPVGTGPRGLPVGAQLSARLGQDAMLLAAALALETALAASPARALAGASSS